MAAAMEKYNQEVGSTEEVGKAIIREQVKMLASCRTPLLVGVSCNPATFARDAAILIGGGFRLESVLPVDQFLWSPHIELVGIFRR